MKFKVRYFYYASGMEQGPDEYDIGIFDAKDSDEACDLAALKEMPIDEMYGPNNSCSTRRFIRGCLTATAVDP